MRTTKSTQFYFLWTANFIIDCICDISCAGYNSGYRSIAPPCGTDHLTLCGVVLLHFQYLILHLLTYSPSYVPLENSITILRFRC